MSTENVCVDVIELDADHTPQLSMPKELAEVLKRHAPEPRAQRAFITRFET